MMHQAPHRGAPDMELRMEVVQATEEHNGLSVMVSGCLPCEGRNRVKTLMPLRSFVTPPEQLSGLSLWPLATMVNLCHSTATCHFCLQPNHLCATA